MPFNICSVDVQIQDLTPRAPGLAPFNPPHVVEKLGMLSRGELVRSIDWFDLVVHGTPWVVLVLKGVSVVLGPPGR